jgi:beta-lactamase class C
MQAAMAPNPPAIVDRMVKPYMERTNTHGLVAAVYVKGKEYLLTYGDDGNNPASKVTPDLLFGIGSVTKTFTAAMLAYQTIGEGGKPPLKHINDCVCDYLPGSVKEYGRGIRKVTLLELATHTSSFPSRVPGFPGTELYAGKPPSADLIQWWNSFVKPPYPPEVLYSNVGYVTLGFALEGPDSKPSYPDLLKQYLIGPLGMTHTETTTPSGMPVAQGYVRKTAQPMEETDIKSSGHDMMIWLKANIGALNKSISPHLEEALRVTHRIWFMTPADDRFNMGLGWEVFSKDPQVPVIVSKNGASSRGGFSSWIGFMPDEKIGIVILTNEFNLGRDAELGVIPESGDIKATNPTVLGRQLLMQLDGLPSTPAKPKVKTLGQRLRDFFDTED